MTKANGHELGGDVSAVWRAVDARHDLAELATTLLVDLRRDLERPAHCERHRLARAWVVGRHVCGCPYEAAGPTFAELCRVVGIDPRAARRSLGIDDPTTAGIREAGLAGLSLSPSPSAAACQGEEG